MDKPNPVFAQAYNFINHHLDADIDPSARSASGPSLDGKGEFRVVEPAEASAPQPPMQKAPPEFHAGADSTTPDGAAPASSITARFTRLASDVADKITPDGPDYEDMTKEELLEEAQAAGVEGRSNMDKRELIRALQRH